MANARKKRSLTTAKRREIVWTAIRRNADRFTIHDIFLETELKKTTVRDLILSWVNSGHLERTGEAMTAEKRHPSDTYRLVKDCGIEPPVVKRDGSPNTVGVGREQMWRTMRIVGEFTVRGLTVFASTEANQVSESSVKVYLNYLEKAGYVFRTQPATRSTRARYRFQASRYTGPKPPMLRSNGRGRKVYDPNIEKVVWPKGGDDDE